MNLFWIIIAFLIILQAKVIRDIIAFRYSWSILTRLPEWLQRWLRDDDETDLESISVFDGWHVADGMVIAPAWVLVMWFYLESFIWALISYGPFWIVFYQVFNVFYHYIYMLPEYRENPWFRKG